MEKTFSSQDNAKFRESLDLYHKLEQCEDTYLKPFIRNSMKLLLDGLRLYKIENLVCSFNGGKDAVVVLQLFRAAMAKYCENLNMADKYDPKFVYFGINNEFDEILIFIDQMKTKYDLSIVAYGSGIVQGICDHMKTSPGAWGFVMGTRSSDPDGGQLQHFAPSSDWISETFMRVNPIINWDYGHVWHFIRLFDFPYCELYDQGYTSIGSTLTTIPNPALVHRYKSSSMTETDPNSMSVGYSPAYMLADWGWERLGRFKSKELAVCRAPLTLLSRAVIVLIESLDNSLDLSVSCLRQAGTQLFGDCGVRVVSIICLASSLSSGEVDVELIRLARLYDVVIASCARADMLKTLFGGGIKFPLPCRRLQHDSSVQSVDVWQVHGNIFTSPEAATSHLMTALGRFIAATQSLPSFHSFVLKCCNNHLNKICPADEQLQLDSQSQSRVAVLVEGNDSTVMSLQLRFNKLFEQQILSCSIATNLVSCSSSAESVVLVLGGPVASQVTHCERHLLDYLESNRELCVMLRAESVKPKLL